MSFSPLEAANRVNEQVTVVSRQLSDEHLIYMLFITPQRDAQSYNAVLQNMVGSLRINDEQRH